VPETTTNDPAASLLSSEGSKINVKMLKPIERHAEKDCPFVEDVALDNDEVDITGPAVVDAAFDVSLCLHTSLGKVYTVDIYMRDRISILPSHTGQILNIENGRIEKRKTHVSKYRCASMFAFSTVEADIAVFIYIHCTFILYECTIS
jgi:hypothetical protein